MNKTVRIKQTIKRILVKIPIVFMLLLATDYSDCMRVVLAEEAPVLDERNADAQTQANVGMDVETESDNDRKISGEEYVSETGMGCTVTETERQKYIEDGTWEERLEYFEENVQHDTAQQLVSNLAKYGGSGKVSGSKKRSRAVTGTTGFMPTTGNVKTLVVTVEFADAKLDDEYKNTLERAFFSGEETESEYYPYESLSAYYERSSYGKLHLSGDIFSYVSTKARSAYDGNMNMLYREVFQFVKQTISSDPQKSLNGYLADFDSDKDGMLDGIYICFAGGNTGWSSQWWSSVQTLGTAISIGNYETRQICRLEAKNGDAAAYVYTMIHETGHMLGLADCYDSVYHNDGYTMGTFEMMASDIADHNGFSKMLLGWLDPGQVAIVKGEGVETYELSAYGESGEVVLLVPDWDDSVGLYTEFYMVEYYGSVGNDTLDVLEPHKGLRIYHVYAKLNSYGSGFVGDNFQYNAGCIPLIQGVDKDQMEHERPYYVVKTQGTYRTLNNNPDKYNCFYVDGDAFTPYTSPASYLYENSANRFGSIGYSGAFVDNIKISDGRATFTAGFESAKQEPELSCETVSSTAGISCVPEHQVRVRFNTEVRFRDSVSTMNNCAYIEDENGTKICNIKMQFREEYSVYSDVALTPEDSLVLQNAKYNIVIPAGTLCSAYGVQNQEIRIAFDNTKDSNETVMFTIPIGSNENDWISDIDAKGNGGLVMGEYDSSSESYSYTYYVLKDCKLQKKICLPLKNMTTLSSSGYSMHMEHIAFTDTGRCLLVMSQEDAYDLVVIDGSTGKLINERLIEVEGKSMGIVGQQLMIRSYEDGLYHSYDFLDASKDSQEESVPKSEGLRYELKSERAPDDVFHYTDLWVGVYDAASNTLLEKYLLDKSIVEKPYLEGMEYPEFAMIPFGNDFLITAEWDSAKKNALWILDSNFNLKAEIGDIPITNAASNDGMLYGIGRKRYDNIWGRKIDTICGFAIDVSDVKPVEDKNGSLHMPQELKVKNPNKIMMPDDYSNEEFEALFDDGYTFSYPSKDVVEIGINEGKHISYFNFDRIPPYDAYQFKVKTGYYTYGDEPFTLSTTGGWGADNGSVTFSAPEDNGIIEINGDTATTIGAGDVEVTAVRGKGTIYEETAKGTIHIGQKTVTATLTGEVIRERSFTSEITDAIVNTLAVELNEEDILETDRGKVFGAASRYNMGDFATVGTGKKVQASSITLSGEAAYKYKLPNEDYYIEANVGTVVEPKKYQYELHLDVEQKTYGDAPFTLSVIGGNGEGAVSVGVPEDNGVLSIEGNTATILGAGNVDVTIVKKGDAQYYEKTVVQTLEVRPKDISLSLSGEATKRYDRTAAVVNATDDTLELSIEDGVLDADIGKVFISDAQFEFENELAGTDKWIRLTDATLSGEAAANYQIGGCNGVCGGTILEPDHVSDLSKATVKGYEESYTWAGSLRTPKLEVMLDGMELIYDIDYSVTYGSSGGTHHLCIEGKNCYSGLIFRDTSVVGEIGENDISNIRLNGIKASYTYTGSPLTPEPEVMLPSGISLIKDKDYTVKYYGNDKVGTGMVVVTGKGDYIGKAAAYFSVVKPETPMNITDAVVDGIEPSYIYNGSSITPEPKLTIDGITLKKGKHYTLLYSENIQAGTANLVIRGIGICSGEITKTFVIEKRQQEKLCIINVAGKVYGDEAFTLSSSGGSGDGTVSYSVPENNGVLAISGDKATILGAGTVKVTALKGESRNYKEASAVYDLTVAKKGLTPSISGVVSKKFDSETSIENAVVNTLEIVLDGILEADRGKVSASATYAYEDGTVGKSKTVKATDISLFGEASSNYVLNSVSASADVGIIEKKEEPIITEDQNKPPVEEPATIEDQNKPPVEGSEIKDKKGVSYIVTQSYKKGATVTYAAPANRNIESVVVPATVSFGGITYKVTAIANNAFANCNKLKSVSIGKNVDVIGDKAFYKCVQLVKINIPSSVKSIGFQAFASCKKMKSVNLGENVKSIGNQAFYKCTALTSIVIPAKVKKIGSQAFYGSKKLKKVTFKTTKLTMKSVGKKAFYGIGKKASMKVPKKKLKSYKTILKKSGIGKKVTITK